MNPIPREVQHEFFQPVFAGQFSHGDVNTHLARDRVIFTLPLNETLDTLVPLAVELLHMPEACKLLARLAVEDSQLVISIGRNLG